jgi:hypothetical protein
MSFHLVYSSIDVKKCHQRTEKPKYELFQKRKSHLLFFLSTYKTIEILRFIIELFIQRYFLYIKFPEKQNIMKDFIDNMTSIDNYLFEEKS